MQHSTITDLLAGNRLDFHERPQRQPKNHGNRIDTVFIYNMPEQYVPTRLQPAKYCTVVYSQDGCPAIQATAVAVGNRYRMAAERQLLHSGCISASYIAQLCLIG